MTWIGLRRRLRGLARRKGPRRPGVPLNHQSTNNNAPFIASARHQSLLILLLGLLSAHLAHRESERIDLQSSFAYLERVLPTIELVRDERYHPADKPTVLLADRVDSADGAVQPLARSLPEAKLRELTVLGPSSLFATRQDPEGFCRPRLRQLLDAPRQSPEPRQLRLGTEQESATGLTPAREPLRLHVRMPWATERTEGGTADPSDIFLATFPSTECWASPRNDPFFVVRYSKSTEQANDETAEASNYSYGVVLLDAISTKLLGIRWILYEESYRSFIADPSLEEIFGFRLPLKVLDESFLRKFLLDKARDVTNRPYLATELDEAIAAALEKSYVQEATEFWGLPVATRSAAALLPFVLLGLSVSLLYRIKRISPDGELGSEPWILIRPNGPVERCGAVIWATALFAALAGVTWLHWVYRGPEWGLVQAYWRQAAEVPDLSGVPPGTEIPQYFRPGWLRLQAVLYAFQTSLPWNLAASALSAALLLRSVIYLRQLMIPRAATGVLSASETHHHGEDAPRTAEQGEGPDLADNKRAPE